MTGDQNEDKPSGGESDDGRSNGSGTGEGSATALQALIRKRRLRADDGASSAPNAIDGDADDLSAQ
jgi:hypothetical protein